MIRLDREEKGDSSDAREKKPRLRKRPCPPAVLIHNATQYEVPTIRTLSAEAKPSGLLSSLFASFLFLRPSLEPGLSPPAPPPMLNMLHPDLYHTYHIHGRAFLLLSPESLTTCRRYAGWPEESHPLVCLSAPAPWALHLSP